MSVMMSEARPVLPEPNRIATLGKTRAYFYCGDNFRARFSELRDELLNMNNRYIGKSREGAEYSTQRNLNEGFVNGAVILRTNQEQNMGLFTFEVMDMEIPYPMSPAPDSRCVGSERFKVMHMDMVGIEPAYRRDGWARHMMEVGLAGVQREGEQVTHGLGITNKELMTKLLMRSKHLFGDVFPYASEYGYDDAPRERRIAQAFLAGRGYEHFLDPERGVNMGLLREILGRKLPGNVTTQYTKTDPHLNWIDQFNRNRIGLDRDAKESGAGVLLVFGINYEDSYGVDIFSSTPQPQEEPVLLPH